MKKFPALIGVLTATAASAQSTSNVCANASFSWAENIGWMNWKNAHAGDQGVRIHPSYIEGWIWCENIGWISMGSPSVAGPYANTTNLDYGVNINPANGTLSGYGWAENLGWINFGTASFVPDGFEPRILPSTGRLRGYAWSENAGWINLEDDVRLVRALTGDTNGDGHINFGDINNILAQYTATGSSLSGDVDGDWVVDFGDLNIVLSGYNTSCP